MAASVLYMLLFVNICYPRRHFNNVLVGKLNVWRGVEMEDGVIF